MDDLKGARVLAVDDEEINRNLLSRWLTRAGYEVDLAGSGEQALELALSVPYDLVVLDLMMPRVDGAEVLSRIRATEAIHALPVIMLSAETETATVSRLLHLGADDYLSKPANFPKLLERVASLIRESRQTRTEQQSGVREPLGDQKSREA